MSKVDELARLEAQHRELLNRIQNERGAALSEIIETAKASAEKIGVSLNELIDAFGKTKPREKVGSSGNRATVAIKYRNPQNHAETWAGRGKQPKWVREALGSGASLESLTIEAQAQGKLSLAPADKLS